MDLDSARSSLDEDFLSEKIELLDGETHPARTQESMRSRKTRMFQILVFLSMVILAGAAGYVMLPRIFHATPTGREFGDCGASIEEARAKGCIFDNMGFAWVQPACHQPDLLAAYRNRTEMPYYSDSSLKPEYRLPIEKVMQGDYLDAWAPEKHHPMHCAFMLSKVHLALIDHLPIDNKAREYEHTTHCGMVLMDGWLHEIPECVSRKGCHTSHLQAQFTTCGYI